MNWNRNHNVSKVGTGTGTVKNSYGSTTLITKGYCSLSVTMLRIKDQDQVQKMPVLMNYDILPQKWAILNLATNSQLENTYFKG
jgi:hypothetical protein